jgi:hypothetical protein
MIIEKQGRRFTLQGRMFVACTRTLISFKAYQRLVSAMEVYRANPSWMVPLFTLDGVFFATDPFASHPRRGFFGVRKARGNRVSGREALSFPDDPWLQLTHPAIAYAVMCA